MNLRFLIPSVARGQDRQLDSLILGIRNIVPVQDTKNNQGSHFPHPGLQFQHAQEDLD